MERAVKEWLAATKPPPEIITSLTKRLTKSYTIYGQMLLLPPSALEGPEWHSLKNQHPDLDISKLYKSISKHLKISHIACNKPIPLNNKTGAGENENFNILRSPSNFTPLYGNFGPEIAASPPTSDDLDKAFWVTAKQNGIYQIWAPRWTMFSRGNISEKARLLTLPSVIEAVEDGRVDGRGCSAVDLYAGIGYFAFSYAAAGAREVLCWDLNAWSCEGLRRGGLKNKWKVEMCKSGEKEELKTTEGEAKLVVFNESNEYATERVARMRETLPPIRHVNCGMLPSSRQSLKLAATVLDRRWRGWIHVHENFLVEEIANKAEETRAELQSILTKQRGKDVRTQIEYINRLKSYAPGVMHCVLDIVVHPTYPT